MQTIQGLFKTFLRKALDSPRTFFDNLPQTEKNVVLKDTGLALWHSTKPHLTHRETSKERYLENKCKPGMRCAILVQRTCIRITRDRTGNQKHTFSHIS